VLNHATGLTVVGGSDRLGRTRLVGHAVLARGRALAGMRQRRRAAQLFRTAIDVLSRHGQPLIVAFRDGLVVADRGVTRRRVAKDELAALPPASEVAV